MIALLLTSPDTAHLLVSATTILLRCTVETADIGTKRKCAATLVGFISRLRSASQESDWELADFCLERCQTPVEKIAAMVGLESEPAQIRSSAGHEAQPILSGPSESAFTSSLPEDDLFLPVDSLDYPVSQQEDPSYD